MYLTDSNSIGNPEILWLSPQIERALQMHSTGYFFEAKRSFSEKHWGHRTAIYVNLIQQLSKSQWEGFYAEMMGTVRTQDAIDEFRKPVEQWMDNPKEYFILGSDPVDME